MFLSSVSRFILIHPRAVLFRSRHLFFETNSDRDIFLGQFRRHLFGPVLIETPVWTSSGDTFFWPVPVETPSHPSTPALPALPRSVSRYSDGTFFAPTIRPGGRKSRARITPMGSNCLGPYWELSCGTFWELSGNSFPDLGTFWELFGNFLGTIVRNFLGTIWELFF